MKRILFVAAVLAVSAGLVINYLPPLRAIERRASPSYSRFDNEVLRRKGCLTADSRARDPEGDTIRIKVSRRTTLTATVRGDADLQPGLVAIADVGNAAELGWVRELGAEKTLRQTFLLPTEGYYTFMVTDRRQLDGDETMADRGCFEMTLAPAEPLTPRSLPMGWRGTTGTPVMFDTSFGDADVVMVTVSNVSDHGAITVSVIEDDELTQLEVLDPNATFKAAVSTQTLFSALVIEESLNSTTEKPLEANVQRSYPRHGPASARNDHRFAEKGGRYESP